jgi:hypothetical protein
MVFSISTTFSINSFFFSSSSPFKQSFKFLYNFFLVLFLLDSPSINLSSGNSSCSDLVGVLGF